MAATSRTMATTTLLLVIFSSECFRKWAWKPMHLVPVPVCCGGELLKRCSFEFWSMSLRKKLLRLSEMSICFKTVGRKEEK